MKRGIILSNDDISLICLELSSMLSAGMPLSYGLSSMAMDRYTHGAKELFQGMAQEIEQGESFATVLDNAGCFPKHMVKMVKFGELTGNLEDTLNQLHDFYENEQNLRDNIRNALFYPCIMVILMLIVMFVIITKVIPIFSNVLNQLGSSISPGFKILLDVSSFMNKFAVVFVVIFAVIVIAGLIVMKLPSMESYRNKLYDNFINKSKMGYSINVSRFTQGLSTCISGGMDVDEALATSADMIGHKKLLEKIEKCKKILSEGDKGFEEAVTESGIISGYYGRMISIGFSTGTTEKMFNTISKRYADKAGDDISNFINTLEPTLIIILSIVVGVILLVSIIPILGILSSI